MSDRFLDPRQTDTERIRDLWIKCDHLDRECRDLRVSVEYFLESFRHGMAIMEADNAESRHLLILRLMHEQLQEALNRSLDQHKPF
tara:strand:+ start:940 stop:1197 length:258 start_codon:yes stop_codon:yes gene_type:complete